MFKLPPSCNHAPALALFLGACAAAASFEEIMISPKPGLVDPANCGSHRDMDWTTFLQSASALSPFWGEQAHEGLRHEHYKPSGDLMAKLRLRGVRMEDAMFAVTGGVNTHKGLIFVLSLLLGAAGLCASRGDRGAQAICTAASEIVGPTARADLAAIRAKEAAGEPLSHGERVYCRYGIGGIRSEAANGFPSLLSSLEVLENALAKGASLHDAALASLMRLMMCCEDTNVIHRSGFDFWNGAYREMTAEADRRFDPVSPGDYVPLARLNECLLERSATPGGAADLLTCTLFLYRSKMLGNIAG